LNDPATPDATLWRKLVKSMASVIKASGTAHSTDAGLFNFEDLSVQAQGYLDQTRAKAAQILAQAQKDGVAIRQRAEQEGKQAALKTAESLLDDKIGKQMVSLLPALKQAVDGVAQVRQNWLAHSEKTTVKVAAAIAARVIRRELTHAPQITLGLVREALEMAAGSTDIQVRLHPDDHQALAGQIRAVAGELNRLGTPEIVADPAVSRGGCRIDTRFGTIDQQFEAQLARIEEELT
jgi:flagellar assembly protein FliH